LVFTSSKEERKNEFNFIIEKMQIRLAFWKHHLLNKPGRLALTTSVLSSIPSYYMHATWILKNIYNYKEVHMEEL